MINRLEAAELLHRFWNHSSDNCPLSAEVQEQQEKAFSEFIMNSLEMLNYERLPSIFQVDDYANIILSEDHFENGVCIKRNELTHGKIVKVSFSKGKVHYDLEFTIALVAGKRITTRVHNVDANFCFKIEG